MLHIRYIVILLHYIYINIYHVLLLHRQHHVYSVLHINFTRMTYFDFDSSVSVLPAFACFEWEVRFWQEEWASPGTSSA